MKITLNAKVFRTILIVAILILTSGAIAGFIFTKQKLQEFATSINQIEADAAAGDGNIAALKQLGDKLKTTQDIKAKADSIAVPSSDYPVKVIQNITDIASSAGVRLTAISYGGATDASGAQAVPGGAAAAPVTTPGTTAPVTGAAGAVSGATKKTINVTTESPVNYDALMNFLRGIETDDMYMHITKVSMTKAEGNTVTTQPFIIEVYVQ